MDGHYRNVDVFIITGEELAAKAHDSVRLVLVAIDQVVILLRIQQTLAVR